MQLQSINVRSTAAGNLDNRDTTPLSSIATGNETEASDLVFEGSSRPPPPPRIKNCGYDIGLTRMTVKTMLRQRGRNRQGHKNGETKVDTGLLRILEIEIRS